MKANAVKHDLIDTQEKLLEFCARAEGADTIAFDTEFQSEDTYRPELCLVQVAFDGCLAVIDPLADGFDASPFWKMLADFSGQTLVHAGREEFRFCLASAGRRPQNWFDVQLAAGIVGLEYPASYSNLVFRLVGKKLPKGETRTRWKKRPLSERQIMYALDDVAYLEQVRDQLQERLDRLGRAAWLQDESEVWQSRLEEEEQGERWHRVSGISGLSSASLQVVRELWRWRDKEAKRRNQLTKRVLRDDLIVEIARQNSDDVERIGIIRGLERREIHKRLSELAECVRRARSAEPIERKKPPRRDQSTQLNLIAQLLSTALTSVCRSKKIAPALVGASRDVRELIAYRLGGNKGEPPALALGWRAELVGRTLDDVLSGKVCLRVNDPRSDAPLVFEPGSA